MTDKEPNNYPEYIVSDGYMDGPKLNKDEFERLSNTYNLPIFMFSKRGIFARFILYNGFVIEEIT